MAIEKIYAPWVHLRDPSYARLQAGTPPELRSVRARLSYGMSVGDAFPDGVVFDVNPESGAFFPDSLSNSSNLYIVSERLREVLEAASPSFEFHRVRVRNHKGRLEKSPYYVANLLDLVDCMDRKKSKFRPSEIDTTQASTIHELVLDLSRIPNEKKIFRLASRRRLFLVRKDLAYDIFRVKKFEGMLFKKIELYGEEFRPLDPDEDVDEED